MRIAVMGAGSLGTIAGALLSRAGLDVVLIDANAEHVNALNGYLSRVSSEEGVGTPVNDQVTDMIRRIQARELDYGFNNLERIELPDLSIYYPDE
jgi:2-dehydropantoate 2-reductase